MIALTILAGMLCAALGVILARKRRLLRKAEETLAESEKMAENARNALEEAERIRAEAKADKIYYETLVDDEKDARWFRHYAFYPLGQLTVADLSEDDIYKIKKELTGVIDMRLRKYFEPKETVFRGRRVLMLDLQIRENKK